MVLFITLPTGGTKFSSLVIACFGFTKFQAMLVGFPGGACQIMTVWIGAFTPRYCTSQRLVLRSHGPSLRALTRQHYATCHPSFPAMGIIVGTWFAACSSALLGSSVQFIAINVEGNTKKSVVGVIYFISYCIGCIVSPQLWMRNDAPRYFKVCLTSVISWTCLIITYGLYRIISKRANTKRDIKAEEDESFQVGREDIAQGVSIGVAIDSDLTERQDKGFRYAL
ncbi:hypothetical protein BKA64DRAFT_639021 [Cadophora sp. MPI-SDFR-AT-0126]|nr:hypothetical protein BKA64DRAFT_639021 [Leotiomycetes sp. MPI-SDFR-AT-0126]